VLPHGALYIVDTQIFVVSFPSFLVEANVSSESKSWMEKGGTVGYGLEGQSLAGQLPSCCDSQEQNNPSDK
jgi:hypothetical protein